MIQILTMIVFAFLGEDLARGENGRHIAKYLNIEQFISLTIKLMIPTTFPLRMKQ